MDNVHFSTWLRRFKPLKNGRILCLRCGDMFHSQDKFSAEWHDNKQCEPFLGSQALK